MRPPENERRHHRALKLATTSGTGQQYHPGPEPITIAPRPSRRRANHHESHSQVFPYARRFDLALHLDLALHNERQSEYAKLALDLALTLSDLANAAHQAAELMANAAATEGEAVVWQ